MKIFFSWSGDRSQRLAQLLSEWLRNSIQAIDPLISTEIRKGARWATTIASQLEQSRVGLICVTPENVHAPWLLFEAGAISKTPDAYVCTVLFNVRPGDMDGPLSQFQHSMFNREGLLALLITINDLVTKVGERAVHEAQLRRTFDDSWAQLEAAAAALAAPTGRAGDLSAGEEILSELRGSLRRALKIDDPIFRQEVLHHCGRFAQVAEPWGRGECRTARERYNTVLVELYSRANTDIFSTCVSQYLSTWKEELGARILGAHATGRAKVVRVFRFDTRSQIDPEALRIMGQHESTPHVSVRVFIDSEEPYDFPPELSRDFTLIDGGKVVGITTSYGSDELEATWHFNDETKARPLRDIRNSLMKSSLSLAQLVRELANSASSGEHA